MHVVTMAHATLTHARSMPRIGACLPARERAYELLALAASAVRLQDLLEDLGREVGALHLNHGGDHAARLQAHGVQCLGSVARNVALQVRELHHAPAVLALQCARHNLAQDCMHLRQSLL